MKTPKVNIPDGTVDKLIKVAAVVAIYFVGKKFLAKQAEISADSQIDTDPAAGQARALNAAMNPSGVNWMRTFDTTNTTAIYDIAPQITKLDKVKDYYKAQTQGRVLHEDLINELGAEGYDKFLALATKGKTGNPKYATVRNDIPVNYWVITTADANIRKTPKLESRLLPGNNIVKLVSKEKALGITTGKFAYAEKDDVTFIEFYTLGSKVAGKVFFYVAKSQVELITKDQKAQREKAAKIPLEILAGVSDATPQKQLVSTRDTVIYDENFKPLSTIPKNIIVGFALMTLDTGKGKYTKVQTVQEKLRWVKTQDVTEQNRY